MYSKLHLIALALILSSPALAQQSAAPDRIAAQIGMLFIQVQQQQDTIAGLQAQLSASHEEVKRLKEKYEPEPKPEKK